MLYKQDLRKYVLLQALYMKFPIENGFEREEECITTHVILSER